MAGPNINTKIKFDGEKEYKQAINEINSALGVLNSEMRKTSAEFKSNAESVEALSAKNDVLERKLSTQQDKVAQIREALQKAGEAYGEADKRTMAWQKALFDAEAAVAETENAIRENNEAIDELNQSMNETESEAQGLGTMLDDLAGKFGFDIPDGITKTLDGFGSFSKGGVAAVGAVAAAVTALIKLYKQLIDMTVESASYADNVLTLSQITGLNTDTIQEMQYASELIDVSFDTIQGSLTKLKNNMQDAAAGNDKLTEAFRTLGVSVTDSSGHLRAAEDVFYDVLDALGEVGNVTERDALSMDIFGKSAQDLNPIIVQGTDRLRELGEEAHNVGYVLDGEMLDALGEVDDAEQRLIKTKEALTNQMSAQMAPAVTELKKEWLEFMTEGGKALVDSGIIAGLGDILQYGLKILEPFGEILLGIPKLEQELGILGTTLNVIAGLLAWIADAADVVAGLLTLDFSRIGNALGFGAKSGNYSNLQKWMGMGDTTGNYYNEQTGTWGGNYGLEDSSDTFAYDSATGRYYNTRTGNYVYNAGGTQNFEGGRTALGENGPETAILPSGTRILTAQDTENMGGGDTYNFNINVDDLNDLQALIMWAKTVRINTRAR